MNNPSLVALSLSLAVSVSALTGTGPLSAAETSSANRDSELKQLLELEMTPTDGGDSADDRWQMVRKNLFGDREIIENDSVISLDIAERASDAAMVPVAVEALIPQNADRYIDRLHLLVDKNPLPLAGVFEFGATGNEWASIETRIRINEYTHVRAVAELNDGSLFMDSSFIKAAGGCSIPTPGDQQAAIARAGKMKLALRRTDRAGLANSAEAMVKISHPNNSGMQFDQATKTFVPAYFVHTIGATLGNEEVLKVSTNFSLSENPVVRFRFIPGHEDRDLTVYAIDSDSKRYETKISVPGTLSLQTQ